MAYHEKPGAECYGCNTPVGDYLGDRFLLPRLMRLAFEEGAAWLVEALESEREKIAGQAAYAVALEHAAGLR